MSYHAGPGADHQDRPREENAMTNTTAESFTSPPKMALGYRLVWTLLGWGFDRQDGFSLADAFLQDVPLSKRDIWWKDGTLNVRMKRSKLEVSIEPRHIVRMVRLVKGVLLLTVAFAAGWWLRG
jgi:hypothetical protein